MPTSLSLSRALLPGGWASEVGLDIAGDGSLAAVAPGADPGGAAERVDGVALPGVPNVHSHAFQRALAGLAEQPGEGPHDFWSWREVMYRLAGRIDPDQIEAVATQLFVEMLEAGYTSVGEFHYIHHGPGGRPYVDPAETSRRVVRAAVRTGIGLTHLPALYLTGDFGGRPLEGAQLRFGRDAEGIVRLIATLGAEFASDPDRRVGLALHSLRAVPPDAFAEVVGAVDPDLPIHIHIAEQRREVEACLAHTGARPVEWLLDHAPVDPRWCLVHATHMEPAELAAAARTGAVAGLCPTTEANLGDGLFALSDWLGAGGALAIGSDSHVSVSPTAELRLLEYGQRLLHGRRALTGGRALLEAAIAGGERALRRGAGGLEVGRRADLVVLDPGHPALVGRDEDALVDSWIFAGERSPVRDVMVGGRWVVRDGRHPLREEAAEGYRRVAGGLVAG